jgi:hypothetical protein
VIELTEKDLRLATSHQQTATVLRQKSLGVVLPEPLLEFSQHHDAARLSFFAPNILAKATRCSAIS